MATAINVKGRIVTRPGVYSDIKSGIKNPPLALSYGNICIIDDGIGAGYGGGAGINGTLNSNQDAIYAFNTIQDFRDFVKGGPLWLIAEPLFKPAGAGVSGVSTVFFIRAANTAPATITYEFENGTVVIKTVDEGVNANGVTEAGQLIKGYGCKIVPGILDSSKYIIQFFVGTYRGDDPMNGNTPYDSILKANSKPTLFIQSPEMVDVQELIDWCTENYQFNQYFKLDSAASSATGAFTALDITDNAGYKLAIGGTESYTDDSFDNALQQVKNLDNTFFLATQYGDSATSMNNTKLLDFCQNEAKYDKFVVVGGGFNKDKFNGGSGSSSAIAEFFDSDKVITVHGGAKKVSKGELGFKVYDQLYKTAAVLGRICGLEPQVPITLKTIAIDGEIHQLSENEQEFALSKGILYTYYDYEIGSHVIGQGINTLQNNQFLVNEDGTSFSIAVKRVASQLNKELIYTAKRRFFATNVGPNRNTVTEEDIKAWLEGFLQSKTASSLQDNLIVRFGNISVTVQQDNYFVSYEFVPNFEISKIVFTGFILDK